MDKLSPELEALITTVIYLDCRVRAIVDLLAEKGITLPNEVIDAAAHKIHANDGNVKRHEIFCRMNDEKFDLR
jgi:hypothetical protein